jgi:hypothetical protein
MLRMTLCRIGHPRPKMPCAVAVARHSSGRTAGEDLRLSDALRMFWIGDSSRSQAKDDDTTVHRQHGRTDHTTSSELERTRQQKESTNPPKFT